MLSFIIICEEAKVIALDSLNYCAERLETSIHIALQEGVVPILNDIFKNFESISNLVVIEKAASLLSVLCGHVDGKKDAIANDAVAPLAEILNHTEDVHIQTIVTECLMTILTDLDGQRLALRVNFCKTLMALLEKDSVTLRINTITAISNMAVNPTGRAQLQPCVATLHVLENHQDPLIRETAQEAIVRVQWKP